MAALGRCLPNALFVTERVDGALSRTGAVDVIELYGNALRERCSACGTVQPSRDGGHCPACGADAPTIRPDVVLLGEQPDGRLLAGAEFAFKRADVVLVVDCDATTYPGTAWLDKARARGAKVVMLGCGQRTQRGVAAVSIDAPPLAAVSRLLQVLHSDDLPDPAGPALTEDGLAIYCFLAGQGTDADGMSLAQVLALQDSQLGRHERAMPWLFPLPTPSRANPEAPTPSVSDFGVLATDTHATQGLRSAWLRLLRFYGFAQQGDRVVKAADWRIGFSIWAPAATQHDLFISRILGALNLCGLQAEARSFLHELEQHLPAHRGPGAQGPLRHWRQALNVAA